MKKLLLVGVAGLGLAACDGSQYQSPYHRCPTDYVLYTQTSTVGGSDVTLVCFKPTDGIVPVYK